MKKYRDNGAIGALLDEYERAILELKLLLEDINPNELVTIVDTKTNDEDCRSIQTIMNHVIRAGYSYVVQIRNSKGEQLDYIIPKMSEDIKSYQQELDKVFKYNEAFFEDYSDIDLGDVEAHKFVTRWGVQFDIEQLFEHAIVHVLRHRRQIERFLIRLRNSE